MAGELTMLHMNGSDGSQGIHDLGGHPTAIGPTARLTTGEKKFGTASLQLVNSPNSFLDITNIDPRFPEFSLGPGTPAWSIEFWVNWPVVPTVEEVLFSYGKPSLNPDNDFEMGYELIWEPVSGGRFVFRRSQDQEGSMIGSNINTGFTPTAGVWYWITLARNLGSTSVRWWRDGANTVNMGSIFFIPPMSRFNLRFGNDIDGARPLSALIDDLRINKNTTAYDASLSTITVPTSEVLPLDLPGADETIFASALIDKGVLPTTARDLWEPSQFLRVNWLRDPRNNIAYNTRLKQPKTQAEVRTSLIDRPYRTFRHDVVSLTQAETHHLQNQMLRWSRARTLMPLWTDYTVLDTQAASAQAVLDCDITDRRFYVGQRVLVSRPTSDTEMLFTEIGKVLSFTGGLTLDANLSNTFIKNSRVYPLLECKISLQNKARPVTGHHSRARLVFTEVEGRTAMPRLAAIDTIPAGMDIYQTYPIWEWEFERARDHVVQPGQETALGRASHITIFGSRAKMGTSGTLRFTERADAFKFLRFFQGRGGMACPFWFPSNFSEYNLVAIPTTTSVEVSVVGDVLDWVFRPFFMFQLKDGTRLIREIASVVRGAVDVLQFIDPLPAINFSDVRWMSRAGLSRFDKDELEEIWSVERAMDTSVQILETLEEILLSAGIEYFPTFPANVLTERVDIECADDCFNSDEACDPRLDTKPGVDGQGAMI